MCIRDRDGESAGFNGMSGREWIAAAEDGGLLQLAGGHGGLRHADGLIDAGDLWSEAVIDAEGEGLVALQLPLETFEAFAGDAFVAVVFWGEADELRRVLIFGYVLFLQDGAGGFKDAGEATVLRHPVSYPHLDVYKRQEEGVFRHRGRDHGIDCRRLAAARQEDQRPPQ